MRRLKHIWFATRLAAMSRFQLRTVRGYAFGEVSSAMQKAIRRADTHLARESNFLAEDSHAPQGRAPRGMKILRSRILRNNA